MKKSFIKSVLLGVGFSTGFFFTAFVFIKAASLTATSGTPLTAGNWNDMVKNFFWGSGSGGIYYNGKVGIGTNAPNKDLHIYDTTNNAEIDLQSVAGINKHWAIYQDKNDSHFYIWNTQNNLGISTGGNVDANGRLNGKGGLCMNGDCKTAWSQVGGGGTVNYTGTCDISHKGYTGIISSIYKICDGSTWQTIKNLVIGTTDNPGLNCLNIKQVNASALDGLYRIDPNGGSISDAFQVYCDMTTNGGGWTVVMEYYNSDGTNLLNVDARVRSTYSNGSNSFKLSSSEINFIVQPNYEVLIKNLSNNYLYKYGVLNKSTYPFGISTNACSHSLTFYRSTDGGSNWAGLRVGSPSSTFNWSSYFCVISTTNRPLRTFVNGEGYTNGFSLEETRNLSIRYSVR